MGLSSLSALRSKSFYNLGAILISPSVAPNVARQGSQNNMEVVATATVPAAKCFGQRGPSVAKISKYPLNLVLIDRCIIAIAIVKSD